MSGWRVPEIGSDLDGLLELLLAIACATVVVAMCANEIKGHQEEASPVVVEREEGDGRTALVLDYEGERYVIDIREEG